MKTIKIKRYDTLEKDGTTYNIVHAEVTCAGELLLIFENKETDTDNVVEIEKRLHGNKTENIEWTKISITKT